MSPIRYDFDQRLPLRGSGSSKHDSFKPGDLPMWVADMDFPVADEIMDAMRRRLELPAFGYTIEPPQLREAICERMQRLYDWQVTPEQIIFDPGVIAAYNTGLRLNARPGGKFLLLSPAYHPMIHATGGVGQQVQQAPLARTTSGAVLRYEPDIDAMEAAIDGNVHSFMHCNPHNPTGRVFDRDELSRMAEVCQKHDLLILSDEIHCDIRYDGKAHIPIASLSPEISDRTITFMSASKSYNLPALRCSYTIIQNDALRQRYVDAQHFVVGATNILGLLALRAAYQRATDWYNQVLDYLQSNRDYMVDFIQNHMPQAHLTVPEGTYLLLLDVKDSVPDEPPVTAPDLADGLDPARVEWMAGSIHPFFLRNAGVALNDGKIFGAPGSARINFAVPRPQLETALGRIADAVAQSGAAV